MIHHRPYGMRRITILILLMIASMPLMAQRSADYGISAGAVTYIGDAPNTLSANSCEFA